MRKKKKRFMRIKKQLTILFVLTPVILAAAASAAAAKILPGQSLGKLVAETASGEHLDLGDVGKPYVLSFFVPNKKEDTEQLIVLDRILEKEEYSRYQAFVITRGKDEEEKQAAKAFLEKHGLDFRLLFDSRAKVARRFENRAFPTFYLVDEKGVLKAVSYLKVNEAGRKLTFEDFLRYETQGKDIPFIEFIPYPPEGRRSKSTHALLGKPAPDFTLPDPYGRMHSLSDYKGEKNVVLVFWSTTCGHCMRELPQVQSYYLSNRMDKEFEVLAVTTVRGDSGLDQLKSVIKKNMFTFIVLNDDQDVSDMYGIRFVPTAFFINKEGVIVDYLSGGTSEFGPIYNSVFSDPGRLGPQAPADE